MVHRDPPAKHDEEKHHTKHVKMQKGTDEVNHGTTSYPVPKDGHVDLPTVVADHVIRQGGAEDLDKPPAPEGSVDVKHESDPKRGVTWGEKHFEPGKDGKLHVPIAALEDIAPHGFHPV